MRTKIKKALTYLLMGILLLSIGIPANISDSFADSEFQGNDHGDWDKSSLFFIGEDGSCELISAEVKNGNDSEGMDGTAVWELYWIESGNPKDGVVISSGTIPALGSGESYTMSYNPEDNPNGPNGEYMFKAYQRPDHPGTGVLWSGSISIEGCSIEPEYGSLSVNKSFSDQNTAEVSISLYEVTDDGDVLVATKETVNHSASFGELALEKEYRIVEEPVPEGYTASYPDGQNPVFHDQESSLSILNTLIVREPDKGSLTVNKSYSNENAAEVTVELYEVTEGGDILIASKVTEALSASFTDLDLGSTYKIVETPVPDGYTASYPNGQNPVFDGQESSLSILNTLIVREPDKGSLTVSKSYSNENAAEVTVELYKVTESGDILIASKVTEALSASFADLDLGSTYKIVETPVPSGYTASYPNGQTMMISGGNAGSLSILNTLIPIITENPVIPETPTSSGGGGGGGSSSRRDRPDPPAVIVEEPVPQAVPVVLPEQPVEMPEEVVPLGLPVVVIDEIVPLGVAVLPKTGELPVEVFYGLGGMITALGAFLKRR